MGQSNTGARVTCMLLLLPCSPKVYPLALWGTDHMLIYCLVHESYYCNELVKKKKKKKVMDGDYLISNFQFYEEQNLSRDRCCLCFCTDLISCLYFILFPFFYNNFYLLQVGLNLKQCKISFFREFFIFYFFINL